MGNVDRAIPGFRVRVRDRVSVNVRVSVRVSNTPLFHLRRTLGSRDFWDIKMSILSLADGIHCLI
jgi:hypothetical protein